MRLTKILLLNVNDFMLSKRFSLKAASSTLYTQRTSIFYFTTAWIEFYLFYLCSVYVYGCACAHIILPLVVKEL